MLERIIVVTNFPVQDSFKSVLSDALTKIGPSAVRLHVQSDSKPVLVDQNFSSSLAQLTLGLNYVQFTREPSEWFSPSLPNKWSTSSHSAIQASNELAFFIEERIKLGKTKHLIVEMEGTVDDPHYEFFLRTLTHLASYHHILVETALYLSTQKSVISNPFAFQILVRRAIERTLSIHSSISWVFLNESILKQFPTEGKMIPSRIENDFKFDSGQVQLISSKSFLSELVDQLKAICVLPLPVISYPSEAPLSTNEI